MWSVAVYSIHDAQVTVYQESVDRLWDSNESSLAFRIDLKSINEIYKSQYKTSDYYCCPLNVIYNCIE